jgi:hypothetical protein
VAKCTYRNFQRDRQLIYVDKSLSSFSDSSCQHACDVEREFVCRSYTFLSTVSNFILNSATNTNKQRNNFQFKEVCHLSVYVVTKGQSAYASLYRAPLWSPWPDFSFSGQLRCSSFWGALSDERAICQWSESRRTLTIHYCLIWDYWVPFPSPLTTRRDYGGSILPSLTRRRVCNFFQWSESRRARNHTLLSHLSLLGPLPVTSYDSQGLRWKYSALSDKTGQ